MPNEAYDKVLRQLQLCPTCGSNMERSPGTSVLFCSKTHGHGAFVIIWSSSFHDYVVNYRPGKR